MPNPQEEYDHEVSQNGEQKHSDDSDDGETQSPIRVDVGNYKRRPDHVDKFAEDLRNMELMEDQFRKNTLQLQKKLGIGETGLIY